MSDTPHLDALMTPDEVFAMRAGRPLTKPDPRALRRPTEKAAKVKREEDCRQAVIARDGLKSRASGKPLSRSAVDPDKKWDPHHLQKQSTHPEREFDPTNIIPLSRTEHDQAETRCPGNPKYFLLGIAGIDARKKLTFTRRDRDGKVLRKWKA